MKIRVGLAALIAAVAALVPTAAFAHARVSPAVSVAGRLQLYSLAVPTEKSGVTTDTIVMTVPAGFAIDSFAPPPPGWHMRETQTGSGESAVVTKVTWTGGDTPTGEDSLFEFLAQPAAAQTYTFEILQTYSDGSIVDWSGPESSDAPAPTIEVASSLGGGGGGASLLSIVALVVGALGLLAGGFALASGSKGRTLA